MEGTRGEGRARSIRRTKWTRSRSPGPCQKMILPDQPNRRVDRDFFQVDGSVRQNGCQQRAFCGKLQRTSSFQHARHRFTCRMRCEERTRKVDALTRVTRLRQSGKDICVRSAASTNGRSVFHALLLAWRRLCTRSVLFRKGKELTIWTMQS